MIIIGAGSYFLGVRIPVDPLVASGSWLRSEHDVATLKRLAEEEAAKDALQRARRRKQP